MILEIGEKRYTKLTNLKFDPSADVTGSEVPINEMIVDVVTKDDIDAGGFCRLLDDRETLWAKYWLVYADRLDKNVVRCKTQSSLKLLERRMLNPVMLTNASATDIIADIFSELGEDSYSIDPAFENKTLSGACPKQSCKTRLQWVCFVLGAYVKSFFSEKIEILPIENVPKLIPAAQTYWKPALIYNEHVTRVHCTYYSYEIGEPGATDEWFTDGVNTYIQHGASTSLRNPDVPEGTLTHDVYFEGITLVNQDNVDEILSNLSRIYFKRISVELDAINNADYAPGDRVLAYTDIGQMVEGFIAKTSFTFGNQAMAHMSITPVDAVEVAPLVIRYEIDGATIDKAAYAFPVGYEYEVANPYFDRTWARTRYIFRPINEAASGTMEESDNFITEQYEVAAAAQEGILYLASVDDYEMKDGMVSIT